MRSYRRHHAAIDTLNIEMHFLTDEQNARSKILTSSPHIGVKIDAPNKKWSKAPKSPKTGRRYADNPMWIALHLAFEIEGDSKGHSHKGVVTPR